MGGSELDDDAHDNTTTTTATTTNSSTNRDEAEITASVERALRRGLRFYSKLQTDHGFWPADYAGPLFLLPALVTSPIFYYIIYMISNYQLIRICTTLRRVAQTVSD